MFKVKYIKILVAIITLVTMFFATLGYTTADSFVGDACSGLTSVSTSGCTKGESTIKNIASSVVKIISIIVGISCRNNVNSSWH